MSQFLLNLAQATLTTSAVILLLLLLGPLLSRRYAVRWRYWAWLAVAVRLLIPIDFSLPQAPVQLETPPDRVVYTTAPSPVLQAPAASDLPTPPAASPSSPSVPASTAPEESVGAETVKALTLSQVLFRVWLAGALILLAWHLAGYLRFRRYLRRWAQPMEPPAFLPGLLRELNLTRPVRLLTCPGVRGPLMTGLLSPTVVFPQPPPPQGNLWFILRHELTHFRRRDILYKILLLCANLLHWFNPLVWVMLRTAEGDLERCCDQDVVKGLEPEDRSRYGQVILDAVRSGRQPTLPGKESSP